MKGTPINERKIGKWIEPSYYFNFCSAECSICNKRFSGVSHDTGWGWSYTFHRFCPGCGAAMQNTEGDN